jgi:hypothetical protein
MRIILYHGTLASLVPAILQDGLKPRGENKSHDEYMNSASMSHLVYLTSSQGVALEHACRISERTANGAEVALLEIDGTFLKRKLVYPDEDYLSSEWNSDFTDWTPEEQIEYMENHRSDWKESLKLFKTIAYRGIVPATAIWVKPHPEWAEMKKRAMFPKRSSLARTK